MDNQDCRPINPCDYSDVEWRYGTVGFYRNGEMTGGYLVGNEKYAEQVGRYCQGEIIRRDAPPGILLGL